MSRRDRQGGGYDAYLPDPLAGWDLALPADLVADLSDAEAAIRRLNATGTSHVSLEGLARFLLRAESVASSKIEGLQAGPRRLLDAEVVLAQGGDAADRIAVEVLANVAAMEAAVELGSSTDTITLDDLLGIHRILMERSATPETALPSLRSGRRRRPVHRARTSPRESNWQYSNGTADPSCSAAIKARRQQLSAAFRPSG